ncbi:MAG TPA: lactoylglutathione lyase [Bacteriovoracaceae bacterium]|nr:lactoylglutathione lyase [Bacteriovoracaceae bacterium]
MKYLHTMLRVRDLEESIGFYTEVLGMKLISRTDYAEGKFTLAFLSYGSSKQDPCIELTHNWGVATYELGTAYGHIALGTDDIYKTCELVKSLGAKVVREPGPMKHGKSIIAFIEDPDGYKVELIQS